MNRNKKSVVVAVAVLATTFAGFLLGCLCAEHWIFCIGFGKTINAFCHGLNDGSRF